MKNLRFFIFFGIISCNQYIVSSEKNDFLKCFVCENKNDKINIPAAHPTFPKKKYVTASQLWFQSLSQKMENQSSDDGLLEISKKNKLYAIKRDNGDITVYQARYIEMPINYESKKLNSYIPTESNSFNFTRIGQVCEIIPHVQKNTTLIDLKNNQQANSVWYFTVTQTALTLATSHHNINKN